MRSYSRDVVGMWFVGSESFGEPVLSISKGSGQVLRQESGQALSESVERLRVNG